MKEIGGYIELDTYHLPMLHDGAVALNCGRNALAYLIKARSIRRLWIPKFICDSVIRVCAREGIAYTLYSIGMDFKPAEGIRLGENEWLYFVNYYSQFDNNQIASYVERYGRVIIDNAQSYFQPPLPHVDTIYTCRKYFGVADGAFLYTDAKLEEPLAQDESFKRMGFLLGRYERTASEFYNEYTMNNEFFVKEPIKRMSKLTDNLLHGIDYKQVKAIREQNYQALHQALSGINGLTLNGTVGTFMYPLLLEKGMEVRRRLQKQKIYIPMLWGDVFHWCEEYETEYYMAKNILPLPIDQRYGVEEMQWVIKLVLDYVRSEKNRE